MPTLAETIIEQEHVKEATQAQMELSQAKRILQEDRRKKAQTAIVTNIITDEQREARLNGTQRRIRKAS